MKGFLIILSTLFFISGNGQSESDVRALIEDAKRHSATNVDSAFMTIFKALDGAVELQNATLVEEIAKTPLYTGNKEAFEREVSALVDGAYDLPFSHRVYVLHQKARYDVSVMADYDAAFKGMMDIRKILEDKKEHPMHPAIMADVYYIAYWIKHIQHDIESARVYCEELLEHSREAGMESMILTAQLGFAELDQHSGEIEKGLRQFLELEDEVLATEDNYLIYKLYSLMSNAYKDAGDDEMSAKSAARGYKYIDPDNLPLLSHSCVQIARGFLDAGKLDSAEVWAKRGMEYAIESGYKKEEKDISLTLVDVYKSRSDFEKAFKHLENYIQLYKEQTSLESAANIANLEKELEEEKHLAESLKKEEEITERDAELEKQQLRMALLGIFLVLAGISLFIAIRSYRIKKQDARIITTQRDLVEEKNKEILDSIKYAKRLQTAILPPMQIVKEYLANSFILYKPKDIVAGDFYWMETYAPGGASVSEGNNETSDISAADSPERDISAAHKSPLVAELVEAQGDTRGNVRKWTYIAAADCTGHGVPGAMVSVVCSNALTRALMEEGITEPAKILDRTRELVIQQFERSEEEIRDGMDIALVKMIHESSDSVTIEYAGANNPLWIISPKGSEHVYPGEEPLVSTSNKFQLTEIKADKQPIGVHTNKRPFTNHRIQLNKGDAIYIFSDGFADQFGGDKGKKFKSSNFKELLMSLQEIPMRDQKEALNRHFEEWRGDLEQLDDVCVMGARV